MTLFWYIAWQFFGWVRKVIKVGESRETTGRLGLRCPVVCLTKLPCYAGCRLFDTLCMFLSCSTTQCNSRVSQSVEMGHRKKTQNFILLWLAYRWKINGTPLKKCFSDFNWSLIGWVKPIIIDDQLHYPSWFPTLTRIQAGKCFESQIKFRLKKIL